MRLWQTHLCIPGLQGFDIKGAAINREALEKYETERSHSASNMKRDRNEDGKNRRRGLGDRRKKLEACAVASNLPLNAVAKQRYVHVDSPVSS